MKSIMIEMLGEIEDIFPLLTIECPLCSAQIDYDYAEYYGILKTRNIVYRCLYCKAQFTKSEK